MSSFKAMRWDPISNHFCNPGGVIDSNLISGRTYHDHGYYIKPWINLLIEAREKVKTEVS